MSTSNTSASDTSLAPPPPPVDNIAASWASDIIQQIGIEYIGGDLEENEEQTASSDEDTEIVDVITPVDHSVCTHISLIIVL
jgi:hypothetical protein